MSRDVDGREHAAPAIMKAPDPGARRLRVLQIAPYPVLPAWAGGKARIVELARAVSARGVDVTVVTPYHFTQRQALADREPFRLHQVPYAPFALPFLLVDRPFPWGWLASFHPGYRQLLPVRPEAFDICQIEHPAFADVLDSIPSQVPVIYSAQNVELDYVSDECRSPSIRRLVRPRIQALEATLVGRAAHVFTCTRQDAVRLHELYGRDPEAFTVLPNGIHLPAEPAAGASSPEAPDAPPTRRAVFIGSDVEHNRKAVETIIRTIAPALVGQVEFAVLGSCVRRFKGATNVRLDQDGDLATYASAGTVGLNPVMTGSGSNMKVLRYLTCGVPVLSTPFGMRGFEDLSSCVTVAEIERFADALQRAPRSIRGIRDRLAAYDWDHIALDAERIYRTLAGRA